MVVKTFIESKSAPGNVEYLHSAASLVSTLRFTGDKFIVELFVGCPFEMSGGVVSPEQLPLTRQV